MENESFDFNNFFNESKSVLLNPGEYFSSMAVTGGFVSPVIKAVLYGLLAGIIQFVWGLFHLGGATSGVLGGAVGIMAIILSVVAALVGLFLGGVILMVISAICKGTTDFETNVRVSSSLMVILPVSAILSLFSGFNITLGAIISLLVNLYALWLLYNALITVLKAEQGTAKIVTIVLAAIIALMFIAGFGARKRAQEIFGSDDYKKIERLQKDLEDSLEDVEKDAKKLRDELK